MWLMPYDVPPYVDTPFLRHLLLSPNNSFGLHCGVWGVDCAAHQAYNVSVVTAACERWYRALGVLS
jgi:hypothetical protein